MKVQLVTNDQAQVLKEVRVDEFPNTPQVIVWGKRSFTQGESYGGGPQQYIEQLTLVIE